MSKKIDLNKFKDVVGQLKTKQKQLQSLMNKETLKEAKKYAEASKNELKSFIQNTDVKKVKSIIEKEAKEIQKLQKAIPGELAKFSKFVETQRKEFEKILKSVNALETADYIHKKVTSTVGKVSLGKKSKGSSVGAKRSSKGKSEAQKPNAEPVVTQSNEQNPNESQGN